MSRHAFLSIVGFFIETISAFFLLRIMDGVYGYFAGTTRPKELTGLNREVSVLKRVRIKFFFSRELSFIEMSPY